ncbi:MAG: alkaline phosphatase [Brumimicrobium sp.]|nr:alkaline phosphatase [Brumimicrobium sp.]
MKRRDFFRNTGLTAAGLAVSPAFSLGFKSTPNPAEDLKNKAKNIIFLVSDGMSIGTLTMADLFIQRRLSRSSHWIRYYQEGTFKRAIMDTASASSLVTDSAAGGSAWGGGVRVPNGSLNMSADGEAYKPILQKFKDAGKKVGCVTTVPITHATPASFCVNEPSRSNQSGIALKYMDLRFDIMLGGGEEYFNSEKRSDKRDLFGEFQEQGFYVARDKKELMEFPKATKPVLGVFHESALPYTLDQNNSNELEENIPTLSEMTAVAINKMKDHPEGFVLQVEGGKVDWAAHSNDTAGLIYDQYAFDEAVKTAMDFASEREDTLIIVTTDHGNGNPGLFYGKDADEQFDRIQSFKHSNEWIMNELKREMTPTQIIEVIEFAQGYNISVDEAAIIGDHLKTLDETSMKNSYKLPYEKLARIQKNYISVGWGDMHHSADYVELAAFGPGSELLPPFVKNIFLHNMMLQAAGVKAD